MPSWLAYAAGGALSGLGQGLVKKGESEQEQRKALALANLAKEQATTLEGMRQKGETDRQTADNQAKMDRLISDQNFTKKQGEAGAAAATAAADAKFAKDVALRFIDEEIENRKAAGDRAGQIALETMKMRGVKSIEQASDGTFFAVLNNGSTMPVTNSNKQPIIGVPPKPQGGSDPYPGIVTGAPAKPKSTPGAKIDVKNWH